MGDDSVPPKPGDIIAAIGEGPVEVVKFYPCENLIQPLKEARTRPCGKPATKFINGKWRCNVHAARANRSKT